MSLFVLVPKGFLPSDDTGQLFVFTEADQDVGFDEMARKHNEAAKIIRDDPNIAGVMAFIGVSGSSATLNVGRMIVTLKARGYTIVMVEQNFRFAAPLADRFYVMEHGGIVEHFGAKELESKMPVLHDLLGV